jgi:4-alpha-glucanotransferase
VGEGLGADQNEDRRRRHGFDLAGVAILEFDALQAPPRPRPPRREANVDVVLR